MDWNTSNAQKLSQLHPIFAKRVEDFLHFMESRQVLVLITQGLRTDDEQAALFAKGRTAPGEPCRHHGSIWQVGTCATHPLGATVTNARPGYSMHQFGLAVDLCPFDPAQPGVKLDWSGNDALWHQLLSVGKTYQLAEGADWRTFPDTPHFYPTELPPTPDDNLRTLLKMKGVAGVFSWFDSVVSVRERAALVAGR